MDDKRAMDGLRGRRVVQPGGGTAEPGGADEIGAAHDALIAAGDALDAVGAAHDAVVVDGDSLSDMGESDSMRLQEALDRRRKAEEALSNVLKKQAETSEQVSENLK